MMHYLFHQEKGTKEFIKLDADLANIVEDAQINQIRKEVLKDNIWSQFTSVKDIIENTTIRANEAFNNALVAITLSGVNPIRNSFKENGDQSHVEQ